MEEMQSPADGRAQGAVLLRRMQLAQAEPLFGFDLAGSVRAALHLACQRHSQQQVLEVSICKGGRCPLPWCLQWNPFLRGEGRNVGSLKGQAHPLLASACLAALKVPCTWPASASSRPWECAPASSRALLQSCAQSRIRSWGGGHL